MKSKEEIEQLAESQYGTEIGSIRGSNPYDLEGNRKNGLKVLLVDDKIKYDDLKDGDIYEQEQSKGEWVKGKICHHWRGSLMIELIEGRLNGKQWYLFPDLKRLRRVAA